MITKDKTITTIFIVPTLGIKRKDLKDNGFINGYLEDFNHELDYKDVVYLLFKPKNLNEFRVFLEKCYEDNDLIIEDYNDNNNNKIIIIFKMKEEFKKDYNLILAGKYSKTSEKFKEQFPKTVILANGVETASLQQMIFYKHEKLARYWANFLNDNDIINNQLELWPEVDLKQEILNYETND